MTYTVPTPRYTYQLLLCQKTAWTAVGMIQSISGAPDESDNRQTHKNFVGFLHQKSSALKFLSNLINIHQCQYECGLPKNEGISHVNFFDSGWMPFSIEWSIPVNVLGFSMTHDTVSCSAGVDASIYQWPYYWLGWILIGRHCHHTSVKVTHVGSRVTLRVTRCCYCG